MKPSIAFVAFALAMGLATAARAETPLKLTAADGATVFASQYAPSGGAKATILLFHQAASNRGEYGDIAPTLAKAGYEVIAVDQRSGGDRFGRANETVRALGRSTGFGDTLPDLEAALAHARKTAPGQPVIVWGSSYSAALVFVLAARHPADVAAVLAFSPGEYLSGVSVGGEAKKVTVPVFVTSASDGATTS